jgi:hypothetical protein
MICLNETDSNSNYLLHQWWLCNIVCVCMSVCVCLCDCVCLTLIQPYTVRRNRGAWERERLEEGETGEGVRRKCYAPRSKTMFFSGAIVCVLLH